MPDPTTPASASRRARWMPTGDSDNRIALIEPDGTIIETRPTRYGNGRAAKDACARENQARKREADAAPLTALVLSDRTRYPNQTGAGRLTNQCAFTSRDMAEGWADAFTYGIVLGWDGAQTEIADAHGWDPELVAFVRDAHGRFEALAKAKAEATR